MSQSKKDSREYKAIIDGIVYRELAPLYQKNGRSLPCKTREEVRQKISSAIAKEFKPTFDALSTLANHNVFLKEENEKLRADIDT